MIQQDLFNRRYAVRLPQHLMTPVMPRVDVFEFPRNSIWHYAPMDNVLNGPSSDEFFLRAIEKKIFVHHELELKDFKGNPRKVGASLAPYAREYHVQNRRFRNCDDILTCIPDELTLGIVNYALLSRAYRYTRSIYAEYYKWWNVQKTLWDVIKTTTAATDRLHFVFMNLPKTLPSVARLNSSCTEVSQATLTNLNTPEGFFLLEVWKWLSVEYRTQGVIGDMAQEQYDKINLVFLESGRWMVINLGKLNSWRYVKDVSDKDQKIKISPDNLQKRFLRSMMVMMENRTVADNPQAEANQEATDNPGNPNELQSEDNQQEHSDSILKNLDADLEQLAKFEAERNTDTDGQPHEEGNKVVQAEGKFDITVFDRKIEPHETVKSQCDKLADDGMLSAAEYRRYLNLIEKSQALEAPEGPGLLKDYAKIDQADLKIDTPTTFPDMAAVVDKSMLESSLNDFDKNYINKVMNKDIAAMVLATQKAGFIITKYEKEVQEDILGSYEMHTVRVTPVEGVPSTLRFKIPKVQENGQYESGAISYKIRKQRGDLPLRKISPSRVAMSSYYGKIFVTRSEKRTNDYGMWLRDKITAIAIGDTETKTVTNLHPANVFDPQFECPRIYSILAQSFRTFTIQGFEFYFNHKERDKVLGEEVINSYKRSTFIPIGINPKGQLAALDANGTLYFQDDKKVFTPAPSFESVMGIDTTNSPVDFSQVKIFGKHIPVAFVLAYKLGFGKLLEMLKANYRKVNAGQRQNLLDTEFSLVFADETLIFNKDDLASTMVLAGFNEYEKAIRNHSVYTFDNKGIYLVILESYGLTGRYLKEIDLLDDMFVDAITEELLIEMKEPTSFRGLLVRASELLENDQHPHSLDMRQMRIKGYERIPGAIYSELVNVAREHRSKPGRANAQMTMNPYAIWKAVTQDSACSIVEDINPIMNIKEGEAVTYGGTGGRTSRAMVRTAREFHPSDMGVISESTTDSSDVAINTYASGNPRFNSVRGTSNPIDMKEVKPSNVLSTSSLLAVGATTEDLRRANFTGVQNNHSVACDGYHAPYVRTGYEHIVARRAGTGFSNVAKEDGVVTAINENGITVKYKDGREEGFQLGRRYGSSGGLTLAHEMKTELAVGNKFKKDSILTYHPGFFDVDKFNPGNVVFKMSMLARVALMESKGTHEDASSISKGLASKLQTKTTKVKDVVIRFDQKVNEVLQAGITVNHDTLLCLIEDKTTSDSNLFDEASLNTLRLLSSQAPTAKVSGILERVEVYYNGDKEDMHESIRVIANRSDRELNARLSSQLKPSMSGSVDESFRVEGEPLLLDTVCIRFYITSDIAHGVGDKIVFSNQLKSVVSEIMEFEVKTESGETIDAIFGAQSVFNRIVNSPFIIGTTNVLLSIISKNAAKIYKGEMKS